MAHFLHQDERDSEYLEKHYACVRVLHERKGAPPQDRLVLAKPLEGSTLAAVILRADLGTQWARLPKRVKVFTPDGEEIPHSDTLPFWVSLETIDPEHLLMQAERFPGTR